MEVVLFYCGATIVDANIQESYNEAKKRKKVFSDG